MTSNRPIEEWGKLLSDVSAAGAILDRLLDHADIFKTSLENECIFLIRDKAELV